MLPVNASHIEVDKKKDSYGWRDTDTIRESLKIKGNPLTW